MFSAIRRRLHFSPAMVVAGLALVFAMTGGAYAAKKYLITSTKQISPSVLKQLQGKAGIAGAPGAAGAQGVQGPAGPGGPAGSGGVKGETGPAGAKGEKGATGAAGAKGATGASGATGFTERLPSGKTETGTWSTPVAGAEVFIQLIPISFPIPLPKVSANVEYLTKAQTQASVGSGKCEYDPSNVEAVPVAPKGYLCVFTLVEEEEAGKITSIQTPSVEGDRVTGAFLLGKPDAVTNRLELAGVWAVTAG